MRDIIVLGVFLVWLPYVVVRPHTGVLLLSWLGYMNPHRLAWGFAYTLPLSYIAAIVTIFFFFLSKEKKTIPLSPIVVTWLLFLVWVSLTTVFALQSEFASEQWVKVMKINVVIFLTLAMFQSKERIHQLLWVIALSIGFFGIKGGVFTLLTGGSYRVYGPPDSFIRDNNELSVALLMILPLMFYLRNLLTQKWQRNIMLLCALLVFVAVLGGRSRGALVAIVAVAGYFWLLSNKKFMSSIVMVAVAVFSAMFLPEQWFERMESIQDYEEDSSAMERIRAWTLAFSVANERFLGGGFNMWSIDTYRAFSPVFEEGQKAFVAHSIYFSVLGEHGWVGLLLFLSILWLTWRATSQLILNFNAHETEKWISDLAKMLKISLVAYMSGGAFLSLAYFDLPWHLIIIVVLLQLYAKNVNKNQSGLPGVVN